VKTVLAALTAVLAAGAAIGAVVVTLHRSRDAVPGDLRSCVERHGAFAVTARGSLVAVRPDLLAGARPPVRTWTAGEDRVAVLQGADYAVLVLKVPTNPGLGGNLLRRVYDDPSDWALVAVERDPVRGVLARCVRGQV
jgi:hypothetical protein